MTNPNTIRSTEELESFMKGVNDRLWVLKHFPEKFTPEDAEELWRLIRRRQPAFRGVMGRGLVILRKLLYKPSGPSIS